MPYSLPGSQDEVRKRTFRKNKTQRTRNKTQTNQLQGQGYVPPGRTCALRVMWPTLTHTIGMRGLKPSRRNERLKNTGMPRLVVRLASPFELLARSWRWVGVPVLHSSRGWKKHPSRVGWLVVGWFLVLPCLSFEVCGLWTNIDIDVQGRAFFFFSLLSFALSLFCLERALFAYSSMYSCMYAEWCTSSSYRSLLCFVLSFLFVSCPWSNY